MSKLAFEKILISREKGWAQQTVQESQDFFVLHSRSTEINSDLPDWHASRTEIRPLAGEYVLIQNIHVAVASLIGRSDCSRKARPANRTASAIISSVMPPWHS